MNRTLLVFIADWHTNSALGLCPPFIKLEKGGAYTPSRSQREVYSNYLEFWDIIKKKKKKWKVKKVLTHLVGDIMDINSHDGIDPITKFKPDVIDAAKQLARIVVEVSDMIFVYRGTEAHTGEHNELEEMFANEIDKVEPDEQHRTDTWSTWYGEINGVIFEAQHHPVTMGTRKHTYQHAALRQSVETELQYFRAGLKVPDWCIRAHGHQFIDSGRGTKPRTIFLPSWKLNRGDAYLHRRGKSGTVTPIGGVWFVVGGGKTLDWDSELWRPKEARARLWSMK